MIGTAEGFAPSSRGAASSGWRGGAQAAAESGSRGCGGAQAAAEFDQDSGGVDVAERCAESVQNVSSMEPTKVTLQGLQSGEPGSLQPPAYTGWSQGPYSAAPGHFSVFSSSAAPGALLGTGAPCGPAHAAEWPGAFGQRASDHQQGGGNTTFGGWQGWHQQAWCGEAHSSEADWQAHSQEHWPGAASSSRPYHSLPGGSRTRL